MPLFNLPCTSAGVGSTILLTNKKKIMTQQELNYFNRFLEMHGAKERFWENWKNFTSTPPESWPLSHSIIDNGFVWSETPQGHSYWADLSTAFRVFLKEHPFNPKSRPLPIPQRPFSFCE